MDSGCDIKYALLFMRPAGSASFNSMRKLLTELGQDIPEPVLSSALFSIKLPVEEGQCAAASGGASGGMSRLISLALERCRFHRLQSFGGTVNAQG